MKPVKMHEAKTNFSRLIALVEAGEEIVVQRGNRPVARIVPLRPEGRTRQAGVLRGRIRMAEDFDAIPEDFEDYLA